MYAATPADTSTRLAELDDMTFVEMLNSVHFDNKDASDLVQKFQAKEGQTRLRNGKYTSSSTCNVEACRNKEVLVITIPADILFAPNDTELKVGANEYLQPIKRYLRTPDMYRVLLVMHTDNTGSEQYRDELTQSRVDAVFDWFDDSEADTRYLFPYAFGDEMPIVQNTSMDNRAKNRRLEIYLVPGQKMLEQAKKGRIAF
jgi:outer membrane protein OmpA-like peptidoglycan-associated protein